MLENGIQYERILDIIENKFESQYIIPVVLDKHRIYAKLKEDKNDILDHNALKNENNEQNSNIQYFSETLEDPAYILDDNQFTQFITLKSLFHEKAINNISYKDYLNKTNSIEFPYIPDMSSIGSLRRFKNNALVLRYSDIDNMHWTTYNVDNDIFYPVDIFNEETGDIMGIEQEVLLKGVDINVIGFMLLSHKDYPVHENKGLHKSYIKSGDIQQIINSDKDNSIIIECGNHGLDESDVISIKNSDSFPNLNHYVNKSIKIIDKNTIEINDTIKFIKNGTHGELYKLNRLKYDEYTITKVDGILDYKFNKSKYTLTENSVIQDNNSKNRLYLFNDTTLTNEDYKNVIINIMLSRIDILKLEMDNLKNAYMFKDVDAILEKYGITINSFNYDEVSLIKHIFEQNLLKVVNSDNNYKNIHLNLTKILKIKSTMRISF